MSPTSASKHTFSVIVPTRERADTLEKCLRTIVEQDYDQLEILVSDNCSTDETKDVVAATKDPRVRYINTGRRVSMSENWEFALGHATADWITFVGDDDGLLPGCVSAVDELIRASGAQAIRTRACMFDWPSITGEISGRLHVPVGKGWERRSSREWRERVLAGRSHYQDLPLLYTGGFVSAAAIDRARDGHRRFYRSSIPDIFSALLFSRLLPDYVFSHEPVAIFGLSGHSTGVSMLGQARTAAEQRPADRFSAEGNIPFHPGVPLDGNGRHPKSTQAFVYESYLQVAETLPEPNAELPATQLKVILATAGAARPAVADWGRRFAALHGLDFDPILADSGRYARRLAIRRFPDQVRRLLRIRTLGSDDFPITDVYEASVVAKSVQSLRPPALPFIARTIRDYLSGAGRGRMPA